MALLIGAGMAIGLDVPHVIAGVTAFSLATIFACFLAFRDQYRKVQELTRPNLRGHIVSIGIGNTQHGAGITVLLQITNTGPPTIADCFTAIIDSREYPTVYLPPNSNFSDEAGNVAQIDPSDMLYEKLKNRIGQNDRVSGFLFFVTKDISGSDLTNSKFPEITVRFRDAAQKEYFAKSSGPGQTQPLYEPGVRDPFIALNSGKQPDKQDVAKGQRLYYSVVEKIGQGLHVFTALQAAFVDELDTNDDLLRFRNQLIQDGHKDPFELFGIIYPEASWLDLLREFRRKNLKFHDDVAIIDYVHERFREAEAKQKQTSKPPL